MGNIFNQFDSDKLRQMVDEKRALYFHMIDTNKEFAELKHLYKEIKEMLKVLQDRGEPSEKK